MVVFCSLYIGFGKESGLSLRDWKTAIAGLVLLDVPTFYMNSVLSSEVYVHDKPVGVTHSINYFSSYVNPLGLALTEKWQWIAYIAIRGAIAVITVFLLYLPLAGLSFGIETPVASWIGLFLLGYYVNTEHSKKYYTAFMILGVIGFVLSFLMIYHDPDILYYTCNQAPNMWLVGCGVFAFFNKSDTAVTEGGIACGTASGTKGNSSIPYCMRCCVLTLKNKVFMCIIYRLCDERMKGGRLP